MGVRLERFNARLVDLHKPMQFALLLLGCIAALTITVVLIVGAFYLIPAIKDWRHANTATTKVYEEGLSEFSDTIKTVHTAVKEVAPTLKGLQADEAALKTFIEAKDRESSKLLVGLGARLERLDGLIASVQGVSDETRVQVKQNGDAVHDGLVSLDTMIKNTDTRVTKMIDTGTLTIETLNPRLATMLDHTDALIVTADGTIEAYKPVGVNLAGMTDDAHAMTTEAKNYLHDALHPPKVKGFWPNLRRAASYVYKPMFDGVNFYYQIDRLRNALPVRITGPIKLTP